MPRLAAAVTLVLCLAGCGAPSLFGPTPVTADPNRQVLPGSPVIDGIPCQKETLLFHAHAHLSLLVRGHDITIPAGIGIRQRNNCVYWLHTHYPDGVIHMEAPRAMPHARLGTFFDIWHRPLSRSLVWSYPVRGNESLRVYLDGALRGGDPRSVPLFRHAIVVLEVGPPFITPPGYDFGAQ